MAADVSQVQRSNRPFFLTSNKQMAIRSGQMLITSIILPGPIRGHPEKPLLRKAAGFFFETRIISTFILMALFYVHA